jgi:DNA-nicking Smr family endonuclease
MVPLWLNAPANRARVLAFDEARAQHGGGGALYVLLKRPRGN